MLLWILLQTFAFLLRWTLLLSDTRRRMDICRVWHEQGNHEAARQTPPLALSKYAVCTSYVRTMKATQKTVQPSPELISYRSSPSTPKPSLSLSLGSSSLSNCHWIISAEFHFSAHTERTNEEKERCETLFLLPSSLLMFFPTSHFSISRLEARVCVQHPRIKGFFMR